MLLGILSVVIAVPLSIVYLIGYTENNHVQDVMRRGYFNSEEERKHFDWETTEGTKTLESATRLVKSLTDLTEAAPNFVLTCLASAYMLPWLVAVVRRRQAGGIFVMNLFLGWTFLMWVVSLSWALSGKAAPTLQAAAAAPAIGSYKLDDGRVIQLRQREKKKQTEGRWWFLFLIIAVVVFVIWLAANDKNHTQQTPPQQTQAAPQNH
jgi:hypothetical protein